MEKRLIKGNLFKTDTTAHDRSTKCSEKIKNRSCRASTTKPLSCGMYRYRHRFQSEMITVSPRWIQESIYTVELSIFWRKQRNVLNETQVGLNELNLVLHCGAVTGLTERKSTFVPRRSLRRGDVATLVVRSVKESLALGKRHLRTVFPQLLSKSNTIDFTRTQLV